MGLLALQRLRVAFRQRGQVAAAEIDQNTAEDQAEQQEAADQRRGHRFGVADALSTALPLGCDVLIEQVTALIGQIQASASTHVVDYRLSSRAPSDAFLGKGQPETVSGLDLLEARHLQRVVARVFFELVQLLLHALQTLTVGVEKNLLAGDQVAAHTGFQIGDQPQCLVGMVDALDRLINPMTDTQQVIDDSAEEKGAEEPEP